MADPQLQSAFITYLPREVRDQVYLELWRSCGLRQHIIWHHDKNEVNNSHFCRWQCTTPFEVQDGLQESINATRIELGVSLGESFSNKTYALQLYSAWKNHFACGERIAEVYGDDAGPGVSMCSSRGPCWSSRKSTSEKPSKRSPYLSLLLSSKIVSSECIKSIYESVTFIFTDVTALNLFVGFCKVPDFCKAESEVAIPPPGFRTHGKRLELSLEPVFPMMLACSSPVMTPLPEERHDHLDFHGLRLDLLENLTTLNIWVTARSTVLFLDNYAENIDQNPYNVTQLGTDNLQKAFASLKQVKNITLSMPLSQDLELEDGYTVDSNHLRVWKRGPGDHFHPSLLPASDAKRFSSIVYSSKDRTVKLAYNPQSVTSVHYVQNRDFSPVERPSSSRGRVAQFMQSMRFKGKWLKRDRKN